MITIAHAVAMAATMYYMAKRVGVSIHKTPVKLILERVFGNL